MRTTAVLLVTALGCQSGNSEQKKPSSHVVKPGGQGAGAGESEVAGGEGGFFQRSARASAELGLPGARTDLTRQLANASRVAIADLAGDGTREIVVADEENVRVLDAAGNEKATRPVAGGILVLTAADLDGDKQSEIYAGWGQTREHMEAPAKVTVHRLVDGKLTEDVVLAPQTSRQEVVAIVPTPTPNRLLVAYFDSKYMVTSELVTKTGLGWTPSNAESIRTATSYAVGDVDGDHTPDLVVGRVYGDEQGSDGDAFVLRPDGTRTPIPTTRGLRALALADADGDGALDIFLGDGWDQNYGQRAHGLLSWSRKLPSGFTTELVEDTQGQYEISKILPAQIDGALALVTQGNAYVRVFVRRDGGWKGTTISLNARDIAVGDLDGKPGDEVLVLGERSEIIDLHGALTH